MDKQRSLSELFSPEATPWLITFCDLTMLLLTFFVMKLALGGTVIPSASSTQESSTSSAQLKVSPEQTELVQQLQLTAARSFSLSADHSTTNEEVNVLNTQSGVILRLGPSSFLESSDTLSYRATELLVTLAKLIHDKPAAIHVSWISGSRNEISTEFPSNWELAAARATSAARQIIDAGVEINAVSAMGFGTLMRISRNDFDTPLHRNGRLEIEITLRNKPASTFEMQNGDVGEEAQST